MRFPQLATSIAAVCVLTACGPDYVKRYDEPLSYAEATKAKHIDFPLPPSSSSIYYAIYADWQAYTRLVRFDAPPEECLKHIDAVLAWDNEVHKRTSIYPRIQVTQVAHPGTGFLTPTHWFTPETITRGIYTGEDSSHKPQIWVDLEKGTFYFKATD